MSSRVGWSGCGASIAHLIRVRLHTVQSAVAAECELATEFELIAVAAVGAVDDQIECVSIAGMCGNHFGEVVDGRASLSDEFRISAVLRGRLDNLLKRSFSRHMRHRRQGVGCSQEPGDIPRQGLVNPQRSSNFLRLLRVHADAVVKLDKRSL